MARRGSGLSSRLMRCWLVSVIWRYLTLIEVFNSSLLVLLLKLVVKQANSQLYQTTLNPNEDFASHGETGGMR
jgi:hypothetical protein